jgi:hypothetical protein
MKITLLLGLVVLASGCGYTDDSPHAAQIVAQAYLDGHTDRDPIEICRVVAPEVRAVFGAGKSCPAGLSPRLAKSYRRLTVGKTHPAPSPPLNPRIAVAVKEQPGREVIVGRYGSTWLVVDGGKVPQSGP